MRFAWRILRADPRTWLISLSMWVAFFNLPLISGLLLKAVLDRLLAFLRGTAVAAV